MTDLTIDPQEYEDDRIIEFTQKKREHIVNVIMDPKNNPDGIPKTENSSIMLMQAIDGLSNIALKRKALRMKAKADKDNGDRFADLASQVIRSMVGRTAEAPRTTPVTMTGTYKQDYVEGELSTEQTVVEESQIIAAREKLIQKMEGNT